MESLHKSLLIKCRYSTAQIVYIKNTDFDKKDVGTHRSKLQRIRQMAVIYQINRDLSCVHLYFYFFHIILFLNQVQWQKFQKWNFNDFFFIINNKLSRTTLEWNIYSLQNIFLCKETNVIIIYLQEKSEINQNNDQPVSRNFNYFLVTRDKF